MNIKKLNEQLESLLESDLKPFKFTVDYGDGRPEDFIAYGLDAEDAKRDLYDEYSYLKKPNIKITNVEEVAEDHEEVTLPFTMIHRSSEGPDASGEVTFFPTPFGYEYECTEKDFNGRGPKWSTIRTIEGIKIWFRNVLFEFGAKTVTIGNETWDIDDFPKNEAYNNAYDNNRYYITFDGCEGQVFYAKSEEEAKELAKNDFFTKDFEITGIEYLGKLGEPKNESLKRTPKNKSENYNKSLNEDVYDGWHWEENADNYVKDIVNRVKQQGYKDVKVSYEITNENGEVVKDFEYRRDAIDYLDNLTKKYSDRNFTLSAEIIALDEDDEEEPWDSVVIVSYRKQNESMEDIVTVVDIPLVTEKLYNKLVNLLYGNNQSKNRDYEQQQNVLNFLQKIEDGIAIQASFSIDLEDYGFTEDEINAIKKIVRDERVDESLNEVKEITRDEWNKTPKDYKMIKNGKPYLVYLDNETHSTVLGPCKIIDESLDEKVIEFKDRVDAVESDMEDAINKIEFMVNKFKSYADKYTDEKQQNLTDEIQRVLQDCEDYCNRIAKRIK